GIGKAEGEEMAALGGGPVGDQGGGEGGIDEAQQPFLQVRDVAVDLGDGDACLLEPAEDRVYPVEARWVERGAGVALAAGGVGDGGRCLGQRPEPGEPSGVDGPGGSGRGDVEEA